MSDPYVRVTPRKVQVLAACETLLQAGYTNEALSVLVDMLPPKTYEQTLIRYGLDREPTHG